MTDTLPRLQTYKIADFPLQSGDVLPEATLAYRTYGTLNADRSNAIIYPTSYGVVDADVAWLIGAGRILDPTRYFIVAVNMFGNGASSSPSTMQRDPVTGRFARFSHVDNVTAQHRLITDHLGIDRLALAYGWSMGAQQALHWGALFPDAVARIFTICGTAKTSVHNWVFLDSLRATLITDPAWDGQKFTAHPERGLSAFGRVYAGWALSQAFYRERVFEKLGYSDVAAYLSATWDKAFLHRDPHNLLSLIDTWQCSDISANDRFGGDMDAALGAITARVVHMAASTDLYFRARDIRAEAARILNGHYAEMTTVWGHRGGNPQQSPADEVFLRKAVEGLLGT
ncbi:alpha/beta fold hydrolase [Puniceibacterium sediminis]|uniref:Homoserine O-acetyltransferase n=1 Tax=Puniceibacterium sediminis TaxID=1608407 RepID=A0A238YHU6_9RHOB|nr:alpha/beta fold hydrolase [Puniceibacterium sediminis]SNR70194.1 homoserine O-acetyltransferase [Puniceibacterium sediminis]